MLIAHDVDDMCSRNVFGRLDVSLATNRLGDSGLGSRHFNGKFATTGKGNCISLLASPEIMIVMVRKFELPWLRFAPN